MRKAARSYVTAAAVLAAGGVVAVAPATFSPDPQMRAVRLASSDDIVFADPLLQLQADELSSNASLVTQELAFNAAQVAREETAAPAINSAFGDLADQAVVNRLLDGENVLLFGTDENLLNSLLGADNFDPIAINASLLEVGATTGTSPYLSDAAITGDAIGRGPDSAPFLDGNVGGIEGATGNDIAASQLALGDFIPADVMALGDAFEAFNQALIMDELAFNANLLTEEVNAEVAAFGSNSALNGVVDRVINIDNLPISTAENSLNSLIGATDPTISPADLTGSLLTGGVTSPADIPVFDGGDIGGAEGFVDQNAALLADLAGLNSADITSALAPGVFNPTEFTSAISNLFDVSAFSQSRAGPERHLRRLQHASQRVEHWVDEHFLTGARPGVRWRLPEPDAESPCRRCGSADACSARPRSASGAD